ncbi:hypothetical protein J6590_089237 [Homalodisca vitripennis]|nr:hypothetical protein J6590_089237 [Homalodisca vitripennis]
MEGTRLSKKTKLVLFPRAFQSCRGITINVLEFVTNKSERLNNPPEVMTISYKPGFVDRLMIAVDQNTTTF